VSMARTDSSLTMRPTSRLLREEAEGSLEAGDGPLVLCHDHNFRRRHSLSLSISLWLFLSLKWDPPTLFPQNFLFLMRPLSELDLIST
jgi:hypothetical protein